MWSHIWNRELAEESLCMYSLDCQAWGWLTRMVTPFTTIDVLHHCKVYLNMYVNYSMDDILDRSMTRNTFIVCNGNIF